MGEFEELRSNQVELIGLSKLGYGGDWRVENFKLIGLSKLGHGGVGRVEI